MHCPVCRAARSRPYLEAGEHRLLLCADCALVWWPDAPSRADSKAWFEHEFVNDEAFLVEKYIDYRAPAIAAIAARVRAALAPAGDVRLLDVGTASGSFVEAMAADPRVRAEGLEPSAFAARATAERLGVPIRTGFIEDQRFEDGAFDVVTCLDTLCLVSDPHVDVGEFARALAPGGSCFVELPGFGYRFAKGSGIVGRALYGRRLGLQLGLHTLYFRRRSLAWLFAMHGLALREVHPIDGPLYGTGARRLASRVGFGALKALFGASGGRLDVAPKVLYRFEKPA